MKIIHYDPNSLLIHKDPGIKVHKICCHDYIVPWCDYFIRFTWKKIVTPLYKQVEYEEKRHRRPLKIFRCLCLGSSPRLQGWRSIRIVLLLNHNVK